MINNSLRFPALLLSYYERTERVDAIYEKEITPVTGVLAEREKKRTEVYSEAHLS